MTDNTVKITQLIAETLEEILQKRFESTNDGKTMVSLEGFSKEVFLYIKDRLTGSADVFWASDISGHQLIRQRNMTENIRHLVIFIDSYFAESQSLAHFSRITDQLLLTDGYFLKILVEQAYKDQKINSEPILLLTEAVEKIVLCIEPSLNNLAEFLVECNKSVNIEQKELYENFGKALWRLGLFAYKEIIIDHKKADSKNSKQKDYLKQGFISSLNYNKNCSSPINRNRFTAERLGNSGIEVEDKTKLLNYARGIEKDACLQSINFEKIKDIIKTTSGKKKSSLLETEELQEPEHILLAIAYKFDSYGTYEFRFGDDAPFSLDILSLTEDNLLGPIPQFKEFSKKWKGYIEQLSRSHPEDTDSSDTSNDDDTKNEISILYEKKRLSIKPPDLKSTLSFKSHANWLSDVEKLNAEVFTDKVMTFIAERENIGESLAHQGALTLHLDVKKYLQAYLEVMKALWENAEEWVQREGFLKVLESFINLDLKENENGELEILPTHPYRVFIQRLTEVLYIELIENDNFFIKDGEPTELYNRVVKALIDQFQKTFPLYLLRSKKDPPFTRDCTGNESDKEEELVYKPRRNFSPDKTNLVSEVKRQVASYLEKYPLAKHTLALKVLNPVNGKDLFSAIKKLYDLSRSDHLPIEALSLEAIGPEDALTLSHFDEQAELREKDRGEMFLRQPGRIVSFCSYEKRMFREDWLSQWQEGVTEESAVDSDLCLALDPFFARNEISDKVMPKEIEAAISDYFDELNSKNFDPWTFVTGPDRIYQRYAMEALSIMSVYRGAEARCFDQRTATVDEYVNLIEKMSKTGNWAMLMEHTLNDYYAEKIVEKLENTLKVPTSFNIQDSPQGVSYLFITPSKTENNGEFCKNRQISKEIKHWITPLFRKFISEPEFSDKFLANDRQWMVPLDAFPEWFLADTVTYPDDPEAKIPEKYVLNVLFKEDGSLGEFCLNIDFYIHKAIREVSGIEKINFDLRFLTEKKENSSNSKHPILDKLKRRVFFDTLRGMIVNPYQAWLLALIHRREIIFREENGSHSQPKVESAQSTIGKLKLWHLRRLVVHFIKMYSKCPGLNQDERIVLMDFLDDLEEKCPVFLQEFLTHLTLVNPTFFEKNESFELYKKQ